MGDDLTIVAHELTRHDMAATGLGLTRLWPEVTWGRVAPALPTVTFRDRLTLHQGDLAIELIHVGTAHTTGDVVAWLPDERILFAGDVAFSGGTPYLLMGSVRGSLGAIDRLRALDPRVVVCGHGPVAGPEVLDTVESYLLWVHGLATRGLAAGHEPLRAAFDAELDGFGALREPERLVANLHRAYAELQGVRPGAPLDMLAVHRDMAEYHGERVSSLA
jgi:cyclase